MIDLDLAAWPLEPVVGDSLVMTRLAARLPEIAQSDQDVVVRGEPGVGKRFLGRLIHALSPRSTRALLEIDCRAPKNGHPSPSEAEAALAGTLLFRGLQDSGPIPARIETLVASRRPKRARAGGASARPRIVATVDLAPKESPAESVRRLVSLLTPVALDVPPLRERIEDIEALALHFVRRICQTLGREVPLVDPPLLEQLARHPWTGNVRELREAILRVLILTPRGRLTERDFAWLGSGWAPDLPAAPPALSPQDLSEWLRTDTPLNARTYLQVLDGCDRALIERALREADGRIRRAAKNLGMARNTLKAKLRRLGLSAEDFSDSL